MSQISCLIAVEDMLCYSILNTLFFSAYRYRTFSPWFVLLINLHRFCNHSIWWWWYIVRWLSGKAAEPAVSRDISTVSLDNRHCVGVDVDTACSLRECTIRRRQRRLCPEEQVQNRLLLMIVFFSKFVTLLRRLSSPVWIPEL